MRVLEFAMVAPVMLLLLLGLFDLGYRSYASSVLQGEHVGVGDLFGSLSAPGDNTLAIKTTIWLSR